MATQVSQVATDGRSTRVIDERDLLNLHMAIEKRLILWEVLTNLTILPGLAGSSRAMYDGGWVMGARSGIR